jgi:GNAT superfamily N-acetyltransferase
MKRTGPEVNGRAPVVDEKGAAGRNGVHDPYGVRVSSTKDLGQIARIQALIHEARASGAILAERSDEYLHEALSTGHSVVLMRGELLVGFATAHAWQGGAFVSHSAMVIADSFRGRGLARRLKNALVELSRRLWPEAAIMSLTLSPAVEHMNKALGMEAVPYCDLTKDEEFWRGCEGCVHHSHLKRNQYQDCHCWAGLLLPPGARRNRVIPKDALRPSEDKL